MIVKNEEKFLDNCLSKIKDIVDEIIIVDTGSNDKTLETAKKFTDKIFNFIWCDDFSKARNFSLSKASGDYILVLDADEVVSDIDKVKIKKLMELNEAEGYFFTWRDYTNETGSAGFISSKNDKYSESKIAYGYVSWKQLRFFKKGYFFQGIVHETIDDSIKKNNGKIYDTDIVIHHYGNLDKNKVMQKKLDYIELLKKRLENNDFLEKSKDFIMFEIAMELISLDNKKEGINYLEQAVKLNPEYIYIANLGIQYILKGNSEEAEKFFLKAITISSKFQKYDYKNPQKFNFLNPAIYNNLGGIYFRKGEYEKAIKKLNKAIELNPNFPDPYFNLGIIYNALGKISERDLNFEKAIELNPVFKDKIEEIKK
jgi:glycosyltransferase involved in cell wall biosynthesis